MWGDFGWRTDILGRILRVSVPPTVVPMFLRIIHTTQHKVCSMYRFLCTSNYLPRDSDSVGARGVSTRRL
jgi:hypothetical protein